MAEPEQKEPKEAATKERPGGIISAIIDRGYWGGEFKAFIRQGFNELGAFFSKPLPDSLQVDAAGAAFNPLYRDMTGKPEAEKNSGPDTATTANLPSPSQIAEDKGLGGQSADRGNVHGLGQPDAGHEDSKQPLPSPSQIAEGNGGPVPGLGWREWVEQKQKGDQDGNTSSDQNEQAQGRSLPDEQRERDKGRGRSR